MEKSLNFLLFSTFCLKELENFFCVLTADHILQQTFRTFSNKPEIRCETQSFSKFPSPRITSSAINCMVPMNFRISKTANSNGK